MERFTYQKHKLKNYILLLLCLLGWQVSRAQVPTIFSFSPTSGAVGTSVTIIGNNFNPSAPNDIYFGAIKITANANATGTSITVNVPAGATSVTPITVRNNATKLQANSIYTVTGTNKKHFTVKLSTPIPLYYASQSFPMGSDSTYSVDIGDFNNDNNPDIAVIDHFNTKYTNANSNTKVYVRLGDGLGGFGAESSYTVGTNPYQVSIADFNGDGNQDILTVNRNSSNVSVLLGNGAGGFGIAANYPVGSYPKNATITDLNNDGILDLIVTNAGFDSPQGTDVSVLIGNGDGTFGGSTLVGSNLYHPDGIISADFSNDSKVDLVVGNLYLSSIVPFIGDGLGGLAQQLDIVAANYPARFATDDFNADGILDIVSAHYFNSGLYIRLGVGGGGFGGATLIATGDYVDVITGDFDGDGKADLAVSEYTNNQVRVFPGTGSGTFGTPYDYALGVGKRPAGISTSDFNKDGKADIVVGTYDSDVIVLFNVPTDFYTLGNATWDVNSNNWSNDGTNPCNCSPAGITNANVRIRAGHTVTVANAADIGLTNIIDVQGTGILTLTNGNTNAITTLTTSSGSTINLLAGTLTLSATTTFNGTVNNQGGTIPATPVLTFANGATYNHARDGGTIPTATWGATSTVNVTGMTANQPTAASFAQTFGNLTWNSTGQTAAVNFLAVTITIAGNLTLTSTSGQSMSFGTSTINLGGNLIHNITVNFDPASGTFVFNGTTPQTITGASGPTFRNLTINNTATTPTVTISNNITVNGVLTLTNGRLVLGANNLTLVNATPFSQLSPPSFLATSTSYIQTNGSGKLIRNNLVGGTDYPFPVGDATAIRWIETRLSSTGTAGCSFNGATITPTPPTGSTDIAAGTWNVSATSNVSIVFRTPGSTLPTSKVYIENAGAWNLISTSFLNPAYSANFTTTPPTAGANFTLFSTAFITTWQTTANGESITIPTTGTGYNYNVDWGDGNTSTNQTGNATHSYATAGTYTVAISGTFPRIFFATSSPPVGANSRKIKSIVQWGNIAWTSMANAFQGCTNLTYTATDVPNLAGVTDMSIMFGEATNFAGNTTMNNWNVSNVNSMYAMFQFTAFDQPLNSWNVGNVTNMAQMFQATPFNRDVGSWDVSKVTTMAQMFQDATVFNNAGMPLNWDVKTALVTNMVAMFAGATVFNQAIGNWNVSKVTDFEGMFQFATAFNQNLSNWTFSTTNDISMLSMFYGASSFNNSGVTLNWGTKTNRVKNMANMFAFAGTFNQNIGGWDISNVANMTGMLETCGMNTANYDATLIGWAAQTLQPNVTLGAIGRTYCTAITARNTLASTPNNWIITGDAVESPACLPTQPTGNRGMYFDGVDDRVAINSVIALNDFTIAFWLKTKDTGGVLGNWYDGLGLVDADGSGQNSDYGVNLAQGRVVFGISQGISSIEYTLTSNASVNDGAWHHIAATRNNMTGHVQIYIDGVLDIAGNAGFSNETVGIVPISIGRVDSAPNSPENYFNGQLDEIKIFNTARTAAQIQFDMGNTSANGAIAYWNFEEGTGTTATNTGTLATSANGTLQASPATPLWSFRVKNTNDSGVESLRQAIADANIDTDTDYIDFSIPTSDVGYNSNNGGFWTILPSSTAFAASQPIFIDGWSQSGFVNRPIIEIDGVNTTTSFGFAISTNNSIVRGFALNRFNGGTGNNFGLGIFGDNNWAYGNHIGTDILGTSAKANGQAGIWLEANSNNNLIGTNQDGINDVIERNVISGNISRGGFVLDGANNIIRGNFIGLGADSTTLVPNQGQGIESLAGGNNLIEQNIIAGNNGEGVYIESSGNKITQNNIYGNSVGGIILSGSGNANKAAPVITTATPTLISGTCEAGDVVELFNDTPATGTTNQGRIFLGTVTDYPTSTTWQYNTGTFTLGNRITATATSTANNTSAFSMAVTVANVGFITTWKTDNVGTSANNQIIIPTTGTGYNYTVYWENTLNPNSNATVGPFIGNATITFPNTGTYRVEISGTFPRIYFNDGLEGQDKLKILTIEQWGDIAWASMESAFYGCTNLTYTATDIPNLSSVATMSMNNMFAGATSFNGNATMNTWNTANVTNMEFMFRNAITFNQNIGNWTTNKVTNMGGMFLEARAFNNGQASGLSNNPLNWNTALVTNMLGMFQDAESFNQPFGANWITVAVTDMSYMFAGADVFNQDISTWNTALVTTMSNMFNAAFVFNQDIGNWNTAAVTDMSDMLNTAIAFNQNLGAWDIGEVTTMFRMLDNTKITTANYDATLIGWAGQTVKSNVILGANGLKYCASVTERQTLKDTFGWTINGDSIESPTCLPCAAPTTPVNQLTFGAITSSSIEITSWIPPADALGYVVVINTSNNFINPIDGSNPTANTVYASPTSQQVVYNGVNIPPPSTPLEITGLSPQTIYFFKIYAYNCVGRLYNVGGVTFQNTTTAVVSAIAAPTDLKVEVESETVINLTWKDNSNNEEKFIIERKDGAANSFVKIDSVFTNIASYRDATVTGGITYFYKVKAVAGNISADSDVRGAVTGIATALEDALFDLSTSIFPNPSDGNVSIKIDNNYIGRLEFTLIDAQGRIIRQWTANKTQTIFTNNLDFVSENHGLYFILIKGKENTVIRKLVKR